MCQSSFVFLQFFDRLTTLCNKSLTKQETREPRLKYDAIVRGQRQKSGSASLTMNWRLMDSKYVCLTFFCITLVTESILKFSLSVPMEQLHGLSLY